MKFLRHIFNCAFAACVLLSSILSCVEKNYINYALEGAITISNKIEYSQQREGIMGMIAQQYAESGQIDKALNITEEIDDSFYRFNVFSYIAETLLKKGKYDEAIEIINRIEEGKSRDNAYHSLSIAHAKMGHFEHALMFSDSIVNRFGRISSLAEIAQLLFQYKKEEDSSRLMEKALNLANKMEDNNEKDYALSNIAYGYASIGKYGNSIEVMDLIKPEDIKVLTMVMIGEACIELGDTIHAKTALEQAYAIAFKWDNSSDGDRERYLARLGTNFFKIGKQDKGIRIIRLINNNIIETKALAGLTYMYKDQNKSEKLKELFGEILQIISKIEEDNKRAICTARVAWEFSRIGENQMASELLSKAMELSAKINERQQQIEILYWISWAYIELGEYEKALKLCKELSDNPYQQANILIHLAIHQGVSGAKLDRKSRKIIEKIAANKQSPIQ